MSIFGSNLLRTALVTTGLSLMVFLNPMLFFVVTLSHLIIMHRYGHKVALVHVALFSVGSALVQLISAASQGWLVLWMSMIVPYLVFTLGLMLPVKRRLHTILFLGLFSGVALIVLFNWALKDELVLEEVFKVWNELMSLYPAYQYLDIQEARINWLYELSIRSVAYMMQFSAFIWFVGRWLGKPQERAAYLRKFRLSEAVYILLAVSALSYLGIEAIIRWSTFDVISQLHFVWTNLAFGALFLLSLEGLGVMLSWAQAKQWRTVTQERFAIMVLLLMMLPGTAVALGLKIGFGLLGLGFSRKKVVIQK